MNFIHDKRRKKEKDNGKTTAFLFLFSLSPTATAAAMAGTTAHATEAAAKATAAETAAPGTAPEGAAAHAAKAAVEAARRGRVMRAAPPSTGRPGPAEAPQPAAGAGKNIGHRPDNDDKQHNADHKGQDVGQSAAAAALPALIAGLHGAAVLIASIVQIYAINARNGVGHIICTGDYRIAIITCAKSLSMVWAMALACFASVVLRKPSP